MMRIHGTIPIHIYPIFWVLCFAIGFLNGGSILEILVWVGIVFVSVLIHEYGHALTAIFFGQRAQIHLLGFGGLTHRHGKKLKKWQDFLVVFNGPLAGFLFCLACYWLYYLIQPEKNSVLNYILQATIIINFFWTVLNLLPVQPLDGGHLLTIILEGIFGVRGLKISLFISMLLATVVAVLGFLMHQLFIGIIFFMFAFESYRLFKNSLSLTESDQNTSLQKTLKQANKEFLQGNFEGSLKQLEEIREESKSGKTYVAATELMAEILDQLGKYKDGYQLLKPLTSQLKPESLLLFQKLAYQSGEWKSAALLSHELYQIYPGYEVALLNALSYAMLKEEPAAIGWLQCAIREGLPNVKAILTKPEFDALRTTNAFREIESKFA